MASLKFKWDPEHVRLTVLSARSEILAQVECPVGTSDREAVFLGLDAALATARIKRPSLKGTHRVGLYNPHTAQVAVGSVPVTSSFSDRTPLAIPVDGLPSLLEEDMLWVGDRVLTQVVHDYESVNKAISAHER